MKTATLFLSVAASALVAGGAWGQDTDAEQDATGQTAPLEQQSDLDEGAKLGVAEEHVTLTLEPGGPHRIYVIDPVFPHLIASKIYVHDGDTGDLLGMMNTGYVPNLVLSDDHSKLFIAETFWSRGARGDRVDVVTRYDPQTLSPTGEIELPEGRFLVVTKRHTTDISPDGAYFYSYNLAPTTSVSVLNTEADEYLGEIATPGCAMVFPVAETSFASLCSDGSVARYDWNAETMDADVTSSGAFFDAESDPVFEHVGFDRDEDKLHLVSYSGFYYTVDLASEEPEPSAAWDFVGEDARAQGWRPGGWQMMSYHSGRDLAYVIMHQGEDWTHKAAGPQVWELDPAAQEVVRRIELEEEAMSVAVTRDDDPILATLSEAASVTTYDLETEEVKAKIEGIGDSPFILMVEGN